MEGRLIGELSLWATVQYFWGPCEKDNSKFVSLFANTHHHCLKGISGPSSEQFGPVHLIGQAHSSREKETQEAPRPVCAGVGSGGLGRSCRDLGNTPIAFVTFFLPKCDIHVFIFLIVLLTALII